MLPSVRRPAIKPIPFTNIKTRYAISIKRYISPFITCPFTIFPNPIRIMESFVDNPPSFIALVQVYGVGNSLTLFLNKPITFTP